LAIERLSTGVSGLDSLIEGGIPKGFTVILSGNPGTGKSILGAHFLHAGLASGESALFVSFSEASDQFDLAMERVSLDFSEYKKDQRFTYLDLASITREGMRDAMDEILAIVRETHAKRVVIDSFTAILQALGDRNEARIALDVILGKIMKSEGVTLMVISEVPIGENSIGSGIEEFVADGIIILELGKNNASPISVRVVKMRATNINREPHVATIGRNGMFVFSKQRVAMTYAASEERIATGTSGLDGITGGGLLRGTTTALVGSSGVGKTTLALQFAAGAVKFGEKAIFCSLEESADEVRRTARTFGFDIESLEKNGLTLLTMTPEDQSPDAFILELTNELMRTGAQRLVIDSLSAFEHIEDIDMFMFTKQLTSLAREYEATSIFTILTTQTTGLEISGLGLSSLFQNIIILRYFEAEGHMKRTLIILKMRSTNHEDAIIEFRISEKGLEIGKPLESYFGVLTGVARKIVEDGMGEGNVGRLLIEQNKKSLKKKGKTKRGTAAHDSKSPGT
jgi:circadian clock protein KaiC